MALKEKLTNLPSTPGVYLMKDSADSIIYVGKAKNLKRRVQSYFQDSKSHSPKVLKLVRNIRNLEYILTDTEFEAFMLECKLIKKLKPMYNKKMKNPLSYTYIVVRKNQEALYLEITNEPIATDSEIFGPYTSNSSVERALQGIRECFKIICNKPTFKNTTCLNYSMGLCIGMCQGGPSLKHYNEIIDKTILLLNGSDLSILETMEQKMSKASEEFNFEMAARYRDYIAAINSLINKEKTIRFTEENKNIVIIEHLSSNTVKLFLIKSNKVLFSECYSLENTNIEQLCSIIRTNVITCFKTAALNPAKEVNSDDIDESQIIFSYLKDKANSHIIIPDIWLNSQGHTHISEALNKLITVLYQSAK